MKLKPQPAQRDRAFEKAASRLKDERDLASGKKSREGLRRENAHFAGLKVRLGLDRAKALY